MRTLEECTAEVFRRSEIKLKKRKIRSRALLCCIPLLLCATGLLFWRISPERSTDGAIEVSGVPERGSAPNASHCFEIITGDTQYVITDTFTVDLILDILDTPPMPESQTEHTSDNFNMPTEDIDPPAAPPLYTGGDLKGNNIEEYTLTFRAKDGQTRSYTLLGKTVVYHQDGSTRILTYEAHLQLLQLLADAQE